MIIDLIRRQLGAIKRIPRRGHRDRFAGELDGVRHQLACGLVRRIQAQFRPRSNSKGPRRTSGSRPDENYGKPKRVLNPPRPIRPPPPSSNSPHTQNFRALRILINVHHEMIIYTTPLFDTHDEKLRLYGDVYIECTVKRRGTFASFHDKRRVIPAALIFRFNRLASAKIVLFSRRSFFLRPFIFSAL